jgi:hypothetical protein
MLVWIKNRRIDIDLEEELNAFDWLKGRWFDDKFVACSPFRYDNSPSFFVNLENLHDKEIAGTWLDSGALQGSEYKSGNFLTLLSFLREETEEETFEYLMEKYDFKPYKSKLSLKLGLKVKKGFKPLEIPSGEIDNTYLPSRGISSEVCKAVNVIHSKETNAVAFLWKNPLGEIQAIKYRNTHDKIFFYEEGGRRLNELLYNLDYVTANKCKTIAITEAEIDALSWLQLGRGAVAVGGSSFSDAQLSLLIRTGAENLILSLDNDEVGKALAKKIYEKTNKYFTIYMVEYPEGCKDMNDFIRQYPNQKPKLKKITTNLLTTSTN